MKVSVRLDEEQILMLLERLSGGELGYSSDPLVARTQAELGIALEVAARLRREPWVPRLADDTRRVATLLRDLTIPERLACGHPSAGHVLVVLDGSREPAREILVLTCAECRRPHELADLSAAQQMHGSVAVYGIRS